MLRHPVIATLGVVGFLALAPAGARGDPGLPRVRLLYAIGAGAEQCPDIGAMREAVAARLGYVPWHEDAPRVVAVALSRDGRGLLARIELRSNAHMTGQRELTSTRPDCRELAGAVELAISLAIDPLSLTRPWGKPPPQAGDHEPTPDQQAGVRAKPSAPRRLSVSASAGGLVAFGSAPAVAGGIAVQGRLRWRDLSVGLEGRFDFPAYMDVAGGEVSTSLAMGSLLGCWHLWHAAGCAVFGVGGLRGTGHGLGDAQSHTLPYLTGGLRLGGEIPLVSVLALRVYGDLLGALSRVTLRTSDAQASEIWSNPAVSGALGLALVGKIR